MQNDIKTLFFEIKNLCSCKKEIEHAGKTIREGGLVAFPTETVYGLGGNALDPEASKKIYGAKGRPSDNPLIVHIASMEELAPLVREIPQTAKALAEAFWPGPLTMVFNKSDAVPRETTGGLDTVAVRMPSHPVARALITAAGVPIAAPSANSSGRPSPTAAAHVLEDLNGKIDIILDGGEADIGLESTIVDLTGETPEILRPGYISVEDIKTVTGKADRDRALFAGQDENVRPKAPGMKYRHYAPRAQMFLVKGPREAVCKNILRLAAEAEAGGKKAGIICAREDEELFSGHTCFVLGAEDDEDEIAHRLFSVLRQTDEAGVDVIYARFFDEGRLGEAIGNRMRKAAGQNILEVKDEL